MTQRFCKLILAQLCQQNIFIIDYLFNRKKQFNHIFENEETNINERINKKLRSIYYEKKDVNIILICNKRNEEYIINLNEINMKNVRNKKIADKSMIFKYNRSCV